LGAEGLLAAQGDLSLPRVPQRIWLVGPEGTGLQSFVGVLDRSPWRWSVIFVPTVSEGADAPWALADAVSAAPREAEVIVVLGSDQLSAAGTLAVYDSEPVARAICTARAPVICALGHRGELYLAEECAWAAVTTPREAADLLCHRMAHTFNQIQVRYHNVAQVAERRVGQLQPDTKTRTPSAVPTPSGDALGLHGISEAEAAARRARHFMLLLAVVSVLLITLILAAVLR
jgi:exodeoxyribonuclease VII large subunit